MIVVCWFMDEQGEHVHHEAYKNVAWYKVHAKYNKVILYAGMYDDSYHNRVELNDVYCVSCFASIRMYRKAHGKKTIIDLRTMEGENVRKQSTVNH